jgi:hypothetical protein
MQVGEWRQDRTGLVKTLAALANTRGGAETESSYSPATAHRTFTLRPSSFFLHIYDIPPILLRIPQFRTFARSSFLNTPFALSFQSSDRLTLSLTIYISRTTNTTPHLPSINIAHHIFIKPSRSSSDSPACVR